MSERPVVVTTNQRGVFFGYAEDTTGETIKLKRARNAYYWSSKINGILGLGTHGPLEGSKVGDRADIELRGITAVIECTPEAVEKWEAATWVK